MARAGGVLAAGRSVGHVVRSALTLHGGVVRRHQDVRDNSDKHEERRDADAVLEDLRSLCRAADTFSAQHEDATLGGFLEHACGLDAVEVDASQGRITLSTIHRSKGKEAAMVTLLGCEERLLPSWRSLEDDTGGDLEEERRMFYVAVTRAKDRLVITQAAQRNGRDSEGPSRFLAEAGLR
jgi:DNA helicase-2/ATP-dependent DNA helicase PcrA